MSKKIRTKKIAILGGGPCGLFIYKRLIESGLKNLEIEIFERKAFLGSGMPYSHEGAEKEHITNVSDNEIPVIYNSIGDWVKIAPKSVLKKFNIDPENFNEYKVLPRLLFGEYLSAQFELLIEDAKKKSITTKVHLNTVVSNVFDNRKTKKVTVIVDDADEMFFDEIMICIGHHWPKKYEDKIPSYFDSPYPPKKLAERFNHHIALKGSSLTAVDAIRTLARNNGAFTQNDDGTYSFKLDPKSSKFKIVMHSRNGLLPAIRFHLEDSHLGKDTTLSKSEIQQTIKENGGFISLDFVFEKNFKEQFKKKEPKFYERIKDMDLETFVDAMMDYREKLPPFDLFKKEYAEAEKSIEKRESIYWKEVLAVLSFAMNYPAKYLPAEDMMRLQKVLMPLISIVIAFVPQSSCRDLMALHDAGVLDIISVGEDSRVEPNPDGGATYYYKDENGKEISKSYSMFVDCVGQPHLSFEDFPFEGLINDGSISPATLQFKNPEKGEAEFKNKNKLVAKDPKGAYSLQVPGITINDFFQVVDKKGKANNRIYILAVPYIGGYNPDYSGIDFCEAASEQVMKKLKA